jgi:hypothetical protein
MGSGFDDWVYWHFFTITVDYNSSHIELLLNDVCPRNLSEASFTNLRLISTTPWMSLSLMLRPTVSRPVCLGIKHPSGAYDQIFITVRQLRVCWCGALSLTRGRVCRLKLLLALASGVILGSESRGTRDHILLLQIRDFSIRRLLRLAGLRCRYSTPAPHGSSLPRGPNRSHRLRGFHSCSSWMLCLANHVLIPQATIWFPKRYPLLRNIPCLTTCYLAATRSLLFVVTGTWYLIRCSVMDVSPGITIPAFSRHVTVWWLVNNELERTWKEPVVPWLR